MREITLKYSIALIITLALSSAAYAQTLEPDYLIHPSTVYQFMLNKPSSCCFTIPIDTLASNYMDLQASGDGVCINCGDIW